MKNIESLIKPASEPAAEPKQVSITTRVPCVLHDRFVQALDTLRAAGYMTPSRQDFVAAAFTDAVAAIEKAAAKAAKTTTQAKPE